jgi:hypothetical protein
LGVRRPLTVLATLALLATPGLAGCDSSAGGPAPTTGGEPSSPGDATSGPAPGDRTTQASTGAPTQEPTVRPATGARLDTDLLRLRFPAGYLVSRTFAPDIYEASRRGLADHRVEYATGDLLVQGSLDYLAGLSVKFAAWDGRPRRLPPVEIDGVPCFHLRGVQYGQPTDVFGAQRGLTQVSLTFSLADPPAKRQEIIDSVLATLTWKPA